MRLNKAEQILGICSALFKRMLFLLTLWPPANFLRTPMQSFRLNTNEQSEKIESLPSQNNFLFQRKAENKITRSLFLLFFFCSFWQRSLLDSSFLALLIVFLIL